MHHCKISEALGEKNYTSFQREKEKKRVEGVYKREGGRKREGERETGRQKEGECFSQNIKNQKDSFSVATLEGRIEWSNGFKILRKMIYSF